LFRTPRRLANGRNVDGAYRSNGRRPTIAVVVKRASGEIQRGWFCSLVRHKAPCRSPLWAYTALLLLSETHNQGSVKCLSSPFWSLKLNLVVSLTTVSLRSTLFCLALESSTVLLRSTLSRFGKLDVKARLVSLWLDRLASLDPSHYVVSCRRFLGPNHSGPQGAPKMSVVIPRARLVFVHRLWPYQRCGV